MELVLLELLYHPVLYKYGVFTLYFLCRNFALVSTTPAFGEWGKFQTFCAWNSNVTKLQQQKKSSGCYISVCLKALFSDWHSCLFKSYFFFLPPLIHELFQFTLTAITLLQQAALADQSVRETFWSDPWFFSQELNPVTHTDSCSLTVCSCLMSPFKVFFDCSSVHFILSFSPKKIGLFPPSLLDRDHQQAFSTSLLMLNEQRRVPEELEYFIREIFWKRLSSPCLSSSFAMEFRDALTILCVCVWKKTAHTEQRWFKVTAKWKAASAGLLTCIVFFLFLLGRRIIDGGGGCNRDFFFKWAVSESQTKIVLLTNTFFIAKVFFFVLNFVLKFMRKLQIQSKKRWFVNITTLICALCKIYDKNRAVRVL